MSRVDDKKRFRWAWRMLPHEYRFLLLCVRREPRGHADRIEMARWLRDIRAGTVKVNP